MVDKVWQLEREVAMAVREQTDHILSAHRKQREGEEKGEGETETETRQTDRGRGRGREGTREQASLVKAGRSNCC